MASKRVTLRELDALVAEQFFPGKYKLCVYEGHGYTENREGTISDFCKKCGDPCGYHNNCPRFSSFPGAAKQVREKLRSEHHSITLRYSMADPYWICAVWATLRGEAIAETGTTEEIATCLCALKTKGIEVEVSDGK